LWECERGCIGGGQKFFKVSLKKRLSPGKIKLKFGRDLEIILNDSAIYSNDCSGSANALLPFGYRFARIENQQNISRPQVALEKTLP